MIKKLDHYVITTSNIKKAISFYEILGFKVKEQNENYALVGNGFEIKLHTLNSAARPLPVNIQIGCIDICFEVDSNLDDIIKYLNKNNIFLKSGKVKRRGYKGNMVSIYINDPDGNLIELSSYSENI